MAYQSEAQLEEQFMMLCWRISKYSLKSLILQICREVRCQIKSGSVF